MVFDYFKDDEVKRGTAFGLTVSGIAIGCGVLRLAVISKPNSLMSGQSKTKQITSLIKLLLDPYIAICFGLVFLPSGIALLIAQSIWGWLASKIGRWLSGMLGMIILGFLFILMPLSSSIYYIFILNAGVGFGMGMISSSITPLMVQLVDLRYSSVYGNISALFDSAYCLSSFLGPVINGYMIEA
ncbi:unnamed protein product, partial [Rotaria sp. Silwood1]